MFSLKPGIILLRCLASTVVLIAGPSLAQEQFELCKSLLKDGVYDVQSSTTRVVQLSTAIQHLCMSQAQTRSEAQAVGATVGIPDLPVALGYEESKQSFSDFKTALCSDYFEKKGSFAGMDNAIKKVSDAAPAIISACGGAKGLSAYVERDFPPTNEFLVVLNYNAAVGAPQKTKVTITSPGDKVTCTPAKAFASKKVLACSLATGVSSSLLAIDTSPEVDVLVPTLRYDKALPALPQRLTDVRRSPANDTDPKPQVRTSVALDTKSPGYTRIVIDGVARMNGTHDGPNAVITVKIDGTPEPACRATYSGQNGPQQGSYHCEVFRYLAYGTARIEVEQACNNGDPSWITLAATAEPVTLAGTTFVVAAPPGSTGTLKSTSVKPSKSPVVVKP